MPNRQLGKRIISSKILLIVSLVVLIFFTVNLTKTAVNRRELLNDISVLKEEMSTLESRNQELVGLIEYFETIDFVETEARTKLNLRKPGEQIIIVPPPATTTKASTAETGDYSIINVELEELNNYQKWWHYFFGVSNNLW